MSGWGVACCPRCPGDVPLVSTCHFYKAEFYCLDCGGTFGFLQPSRALRPGKRLDERCARYQAEWLENAGHKLITPHSWLVDCELCRGRDAYHADHATGAEWAAHEEALAWIEKRKKKVRA